MGNSLQLKQVVCCLSTPNCGKTFKAVLKFGNGRSYNIPLGKFSLPGSLQGKQAVLDLELREKIGQGFGVKVLSVQANNQTYSLPNGSSSSSSVDSGAVSVPCKPMQASSVATSNFSVGQQQDSADSVAPIILQSGPAGAEVPPVTVPAFYPYEYHLLHICVVELAKHPNFCLPITSLCSRSTKIAPGERENILKGICRKYSSLLQLREMSKQLFVFLKAMDVGAAEQLLKVGNNVAVFPGTSHQLPVEVEHNLSAWVVANTVVMDGLQGHFYYQQPKSILVFNFDKDQLSVTFESRPDMNHPFLNEKLVSVCLKIAAVQRELQVQPLSLTVQVAPCQEMKILTAEGLRFEFNRAKAIRIGPGMALNSNSAQLLQHPDMILKPGSVVQLLEQEISKLSRSAYFLLISRAVEQLLESPRTKMGILYESRAVNVTLEAFKHSLKTETRLFVINQKNFVTLAPAGPEFINRYLTLCPLMGVDNGFKLAHVLPASGVPQHTTGSYSQLQLKTLLQVEKLPGRAYFTFEANFSGTVFYIQINKLKEKLRLEKGGPQVGGGQIVIGSDESGNLSLQYSLSLGPDSLGQVTGMSGPLGPQPQEQTKKQAAKLAKKTKKKRYPAKTNSVTAGQEKVTILICIQLQNQPKLVFCFLALN